MTVTKKISTQTDLAGQKPDEPVIRYVDREEVIRIDQEISEQYAWVLKKLAE